MTIIQPNQNPAAVIDASKDTEFQLVAGRSYGMSGNWVPVRGGWTLDCNGATITTIQPPGTSSVIRVMHPSVVIKNGTWQQRGATAAVLFRFLAPDCKAINNVQIGPALTTFAFISASNCEVSGNTIPLTNSCSVWLQDAHYAQVTGNKIAGSYGEVGFRVEGGEGINFSGNTCNSSGQNLKGSREWRIAGVGCVDSNNTSDDYARIGQGVGMTSAGQSVAGLTVTENTWTGMKTVTCNILIESGVIVATKNKFAVIGTHPPIQIGSPMHLTVDAPGLYDPQKKTAAMIIVGG